MSRPGRGGGTTHRDVPPIIRLFTEYQVFFVKADSPIKNAKDLADIPDNVKNGMEIILVKHVTEVLKHALTRQPVAIEWTEPVNVPVPVIEDEPATAVAH